MIKTSPIYQQLFKEGAIQEYRVNIDGVAYGHEIIKDSVSLQQNLLDKSTFTVGSFTISVLKLKLKLPSENIPHNANVVFSYRYNNGDVQSEWIEKFKGKITKRTKYTEEVTSIEAKDKASNYDKFLDFFGDVIDKYPANTRKVASLCSSHLGLEIENMNDVINLDIVEYPNELTMVEMLKNIARNSGGNWVISGDRLRLVTTGNKYYTWVKFADDDQGNGMSDSEDGKTHYGILFNQSSETPSNNLKDYDWKLIPSDRNLLKNSNFINGKENWEIENGTLGNKNVSTVGTLGLKQVVGNENLIPNSWDSFEPYGSGKNYVDNWDFTEGKKGWSNFNSTFEVIDNTLKVFEQTHRFGYVLQKLELNEDKYMVRVKRNELSNVDGVMRIISPQGDTLGIVLGKGVTEYEITLEGKTDLYFYPQNKLGEMVDGGELWLDWVQVTSVDNQHLIIEKTPLENGLTRIQTWGGNSDRKIVFNYPTVGNRSVTTSFYIENIAKGMWISSNNNLVVKDILENEKTFIFFTEDADIARVSNLRIRTDNQNLDFIASDPIIVEGTPPEDDFTLSFEASESGSMLANYEEHQFKSGRNSLLLNNYINGVELYLTPDTKANFTNFKLEKGDVATDWSPTIEETTMEYPARSVETSSLLSPISKILMYYADESAFESGVDTGSTLEIDSPWGTQSSADYVHGVLNGYEYVPIKIEGAYIDPAIELGDIVSIDGHDVLVANVKWVFDGIVTADIEVPINNEINYDDPYNQLVQNQFKRKVSLGDSYQGVTISRDKGIEMLVSPDRTEENATGRYYADLYRGIAFQTRDNKNQDWHDWMYFDLNENMFKLSLYETKEITDGKFINLTNKYNNLVMTVDGLSSEIAQIQGGNIISNFVGELGVFDWSFEAEPLYPRNDLYPNNKLHPRDRNGAIMRVVETDTAAGTGFELFAIGKAISQYAIVEGGADYSLYTRTKGANGVRFILREYSSADGSGSYQETVLATAVSSSNWTTLNHTLTIKQHTQSVRMVVEKTNYQETVFTNSSFNFGNPRPYTQSIADVNAKADYAKTLSEQTALEFTQTAQLVEQLDERVISSESKIIQNANEISTKVNKNSVISEINQSAETISIKANKVELEGYTSINKHFKVLPNGDVEFTNATGNNMTITGNLTAGRIAGLNFNNSKITFPNGKLTLNSNTNSIDFGSGLQMEHSTFRTDLAVYDVAYFKSPTANTGVQIGVERGAGGRSIPFVMAQAIYGVSSQYPLILNGVYGDIAYKGRILYIDSNGYVRAR